MPSFLCYCLRDEHEDFRLAELNSCAKLYNVPIHYDAQTFSNQDIFLYVDFPSEQDAVKVIGRCVLMKGVYEVWADTTDHTLLIDKVQEFIAENEERVQEFIGEETTYRMEVDPYGNKLTRQERTAIVDKLTSSLPIRAKVNNKTAANEFHILEHWEGATHVKDTVQLKRVIFARKIGGSSRNLLAHYDLKKRLYIGTTSMNSTLSFLVTNQALIDERSYVLDPFVGTGSLLTSAAHWGARVVGTDLDMRVLRGKDNTKPKRAVKEQFRRKPKVEQPRDKLTSLNIETNFEQYGLTNKSALDLMRVDLNQCNVWRFANKSVRGGCEGIFDAIICDPPYGIRAGARKIGKKEELIKTVTEEFVENHIPATEIYEVDELMQDLLEFAAQALVLHGRLVYWFPTNSSFKESDLPSHRCFTLIANSCDVLNSKNHRRLITVEKTRCYSPQ